MNSIVNINRALLKKENVLLMYGLHGLRSDVKSKIMKLCIHKMMTEI